MQGTKESSLKKQLYAIGGIILVCYILRLWPFIVALLAVELGLIVCALVKHQEGKEAAPPPAPLPVCNRVVSLEKEAYSRACKKVSELVTKEYPDARWVWGCADAKKRILRGWPVHILLNRAGGYRQAQVVLLESEVIGLRFDPESAAPQPEEKPWREPFKNDYSLLAFQWADAAAPGLRERCTEAVRHGITKVVLPESELPVRESWPAICEELRRAGFPPAHAAPEGIWLDLTKEGMVQHERNA